MQVRSGGRACPPSDYTMLFFQLKLTQKATESNHCATQTRLFDHVDILPHNTHVPDGTVSPSDLARYPSATHPCSCLGSFVSTLYSCGGAFVFGALVVGSSGRRMLAAPVAPTHGASCIRTLEALARRFTVVQEESDNSRCVDLTEKNWPRASQLCVSKADNNPCIDH